MNTTTTEAGSNWETSLNRILFSLEALAAIKRIARKSSTFTTDDVWNDLNRRGITLVADSRVLGPIMQAAARDGLIKSTNRTRKTTRASNHRRPLTIWRSL